MKNREFKRMRVVQGRCIGWIVSSCIPVFIAIFALLITSCSTEKAKWGNIQYHNTSCHYNVWWNGNESLKSGKLKLQQAVIDDFTQLLPPEKLGNADAARSVYPEMDRAIEKGVKGIKQHSIYVKGEEHVPYIKECYLLTAYATFYKQDYAATANTCNILITQFNGTRAADEGAVLLARCMTQEKRYSEAEATLDQLVRNLAKGNFSRNQRDKLYMAMVEATVPQEKYKKAVEYIHQTIESGSDRTTKARLTFLMAQIYQKLDKRPVAAKYYHEVLQYSPEYVLEFNAKLGEASCADLAHSDLKKLERQLDNMLADKKNEEYQDQIYYAKGEMYMGMKDAQHACQNFKKSVAVSTSNRAQKAKSALRLGEVLYEVYEDYNQSQMYYDTAMQVINKDYPHYASIKRRYDILSELVSYTRVYERCDSLLHVAVMSEEERLALINSKIDTLKKQEEEAKELALLAELQAETKAMQNTLTGDWYFYNANTVAKGKETFRQRWGARVLEDYWFISHKTSMSMNFLEEEQEEDDEEEGSENDTLQDKSTKKGKYGNPEDPHDVAYYLKDLPSTQHDLDSIDSLTSICLLNAGYIFYDGINNVPRALECYLRLANDYTSFEDIVQAFYMLYRIYDKQGNTPQSNYYRDMVLMGFPDSDFANLIRDNEYYKELMQRDKRIVDDYEEVYTQYAQRHYSTVVRLVDNAEEIYHGNRMLGKFRYWKGLALARRGDKQKALSVFGDILSSTSPTDSIHVLAEAQMNNIFNDSTMLADSNNENITEADEQRVKEKTENERLPEKNEEEAEKDDLPEESQVYRYRENQQYYVIILINDKNIKATELQYKIADFNTQYYSNTGYKVNAMLFTDSTQLITIHRFMSADEAMNYYNHLKQDESPLRRYSDKDHTEYAISTQNYATFYNRKDPSAYEPFFEKYYLKRNNKQ